MTQEEWENATEEERNAEYVRCIDPVYVYNTYWVNADGSKPDPMTQEKWNQLQEMAENYNRSRFRRRNYPKPLTIDELKRIPEYFKPKQQ